MPSLEFNAGIRRLPEDRQNLIFRIRRQIAEGTYEDDQKLQLALDRLVDRHTDDPSDSF